MKIILDKNTPYAVEAFSTLGEVTALRTLDFNAGAVRDADVLIVRSETKVSSGLLDGSAVKFVGTVTIGTDHIDVPWLTSHGIGFASAPGSNADSVCEYVVAALLLLEERLGFDLREKTLGIVGVGNIGSRVERAARALGMKVLLNDPPLARTTGDPRYRPLDELTDADILTLHVPLTRQGEDATYHFFDERRLASMKRGAILLNSSRGPVVETTGLKRVLEAGHLRAVVLDVWEHEPSIDTNLLVRTTIGTPHIAGYSLDGKVNALRMIYAAVCRHFGLAPAWNIGSEDLPAPPAATAALPVNAPPDTARIREVVRQCYDIERDDGNLRAILQVREEHRGRVFMELRTGYRIRREFPATHIAGGSPELRRVLRNLRFTCDP